ncbi:F0F1 ATP synthase subunit B family protein [Nocardia niigatensis]|uniref:F0F1 ATP synthase subunit B family protein n=1 Tax=Nocardia niigatensis TaxID=209249 RepID=UPI00031D419B|nr:ATP synthase F0F1 subunit delta [Nocardia niigatensis]
MILTDTHLAEGIYNITFDWPVFFSQLFGFAVIVWFVMKYVVPPVRRIMNNAQDQIRRQLEESEAAAERLATAKAAYDNAVAEAQAELDRMREEARADADRIILQMREAAAAEVERVRKQGRDQILQYRRQMIRDLEQDLAAAMLALTEEKVREQIGSPQARAESIEKFLEDLEALANSGEAARRQPQTERK